MIDSNPPTHIYTEEIRWAIIIIIVVVAPFLFFFLPHLLDDSVLFLLFRGGFFGEMRRTTRVDGELSWTKRTGFDSDSDRRDQSKGGFHSFSWGGCVWQLDFFFSFWEAVVYSAKR